jgi:hypothetical protein
MYQTAVLKMTTSFTYNTASVEFETECRMCITGTFVSVANKGSLHLEAYLETTQHKKNVQIRALHLKRMIVRQDGC